MSHHRGPGRGCDGNATSARTEREGRLSCWVADALAHRTVSTVCLKEQKAALISARKDVCLFSLTQEDRG